MTPDEAVRGAFLERGEPVTDRVTDLLALYDGDTRQLATALTDLRGFGQVRSMQRNIQRYVRAEAAAGGQTRTPRGLLPIIRMLATQAAIRGTVARMANQGTSVRFRGRIRISRSVRWVPIDMDLVPLDLDGTLQDVLQHGAAGDWATVVDTFTGELIDAWDMDGRGLAQMTTMVDVDSLAIAPRGEL